MNLLLRLGRRGVLFALLGVAVLWSAFPIVFLIMGSFKPGAEIWAYPPSLAFEPTLASYRDLPTLAPMYLPNLWNSVVVTVVTTLATLALSVGAAFVFSRLRAGWLKGPALLVILVRMFPPIIVIIPLYPVFANLGLLDTLTPLVLAGIAFSVSISTLLLKTFIDDIPIELEEAAQIDGCGRVEAFVRVTLPLVTPAIGAIGLFVAITIWNDYLFPLVFTSTEARTAPVAIAVAINNPDGVKWGALLAMSTIHLAPMLALVMLLYRQLVTVMTVGAVKG
ncbi:MAG: carbohydrate ABC transporter permease [Alphaproteobacteria bacterium]|nr:carbohydrate ABC transporter permease [Alphaproteobacteria bacterium]